MDSAELHERVKAFVQSIQSHRIDYSKVEKTVFAWINAGFLTKKQAEQLCELVKQRI
jgi:hypothetical protein